MNPRWPKLLKRRQPQPPLTDREIENILVSGREIHLPLAPDLTARVTMDGVTIRYTDEQVMTEDEARSLLLCARYAATCAPKGPARTRFTDAHGTRNIPVRLTPGQNQYVGDVLAAYFRLNPTGDTTA